MSYLLFVAVLLGILLLVDWLIIRAVWRVVNKPVGASVQPVQKPDRFWRWFAVAVFALIAIPFLISIVGLLAAIAIPNFVKARAQSQENARRAAAQMATNQLPAQNLSFGPVVEKWLAMRDDIINWTDLLDLDTGAVVHLLDFPDRIHSGFAINYSVQYNIAGLAGMNGVVIEVSNPSQWDGITDLETVERLQASSNSPGLRVVSPTQHANQHLPLTYLFKSAVGKIGILQITGFSENPRGVKIRYKLVQNKATELSEPPKLLFLAWADQHGGLLPGGVRHPDGSPAANDPLIDLARVLIAGNESDKQWNSSPRPHLLHLWYSFPPPDGNNLIEVTLLDDQNKLLPFSQVGSGVNREDGTNSFGPIHRIWCAAELRREPEATNLPAHVTVRLRYTTGPLDEHLKDVPIIDTNRGYTITEADLERQVINIGQDMDGKAFITLAVFSDRMKDRQIGVRAVAKDGRELKVSKGGGMMIRPPDLKPGIEPQSFWVDAPLTNIEKFITGTRPIRSVEWTNVVLPSK